MIEELKFIPFDDELLASDDIGLMLERAVANELLLYNELLFSFDADEIFKTPEELLASKLINVVDELEETGSDSFV